MIWQSLLELLKNIKSALKNNGFKSNIEEFSKEEMSGLLVGFFYDQYKDKWREPINLPDPLFIKSTVDGKCSNPLINDESKTEISLNIQKGLFARYSQGKNFEVFSERFVSSYDSNLSNIYIVVFFLFL